MKTKNLFVILGIVLAILMIPFVAMQFTTEVNWSAFDFLVMGTLLFLTGLAINYAILKLASLKSKIIVCGIILILLFTIWAELAVGVFGTPFAGS